MMRLLTPDSPSSTEAYWPVRPISWRTWCAWRPTSYPHTRACPPSGRSRVARIRTAVVLPAPFGPSTPSTVPGRATRSTPASAVVLPNRLTRPLASIALVMVSPLPWCHGHGQPCRCQRPHRVLAAPHRSLPTPWRAGGPTGRSGFVKRCTCVVCGAPKKLPTVTAYVYCDYCASLIDYDLRRACEGDTAPDPAYAATVNSTQAAAREAATARAFDPASQALEAEMRQRVMGLRYTGNMMSPAVAPDSFWPMADTLEKQIETGRVLYRSAGLADLDPDHAEHLTGKFAWSGFCQGWLGMLPADAAAQLLDRAGLTNEYVPVQAEDGEPRHCGGCGGEFRALPGATAMICEGCGRRMDLGSAEIPCASCGAVMTLPAGADRIACPFCQAQVERAGIS